MSEECPVPEMREDGLQLDEDRAFQEKFWNVQRVSWIVFGLFMLAALAGLTGSGGPLQKQQVEFAAATVELPRFSRWEASDSMEITFDQPSAARSVVIGEGFFERFVPEVIVPAPQEAVLTKGGQTLRFDTDGAPPQRVRIDMRSMHFGWTKFDLTIGDETRTISLIVLP